jgi:hypothetical protein
MTQRDQREGWEVVPCTDRPSAQHSNGGEAQAMSEVQELGTAVQLCSVSRQLSEARTA